MLNPSPRASRRGGEFLIPPEQLEATRERERQARMARFSQGAAHIAQMQDAPALDDQPAFHPDVNARLADLAERFAAMNQRG